MKYFNVTVMEKGKKRQELVKAVNKMAAINFAKQKFPMTMVMKAIETSAPLEDSVSALFPRIQKAFKAKIPLNDKSSTIPQMAAMTDAYIPINET